MQTLHSLFSVSCLNSIEYFPTDTKLPTEHIEPLQLSLDVVPSPLEAVKILHVPLCSRLLQGLTTIAMKKNLRQVYMYVLYIHMCTLWVIHTICVYVMVEYTKSQLKDPSVIQPVDTNRFSILLIGVERYIRTYVHTYQIGTYLFRVNWNFVPLYQVVSSVRMYICMCVLRMWVRRIEQGMYIICMCVLRMWVIEQGMYIICTYIHTYLSHTYIHMW